ncbi:MAG: hypothetical protein ACLP2H_18775 [Terriglobales bacterium]
MAEENPEYVYRNPVEEKTEYVVEVHTGDPDEVLTATFATEQEARAAIRFFKVTHRKRVLDIGAIMLGPDEDGWVVTKGSGK